MNNEITLSGEGLGILMACSPTPIHHWAAFASWYSIKRNLPDAQMAIVIDLGEVKWNLFGWVYRSKMKSSRQSLDTDLQALAQEKLPESKAWMVISPHVMAVREYDPLSIGPVPAKGEQAATFVDYQQGCGKFVVEKWINRLRPPFNQASKILGTEDITVNEQRVLQLWEQCSWLYATM